MTDPSPRTLYIIYNASGTVAGKLIYGYRKLTCPSKPNSTSSAASGTSNDVEPVCAACDITHGGLSLNETAAWKQAKTDIESSSPGLKVVQLHRNEVTESLKDFVKRESVRYPTVILEQGRAPEGVFKVVMDNKGLAECDGNSAIFSKKLKDSGVL